MVIPDQIGECCRSGNTPKGMHKPRGWWPSTCSVQSEDAYTCVWCVCVVLLVRCRKMYCFAPRVRFKPSSSNIDRWIWEYAWLCLLEISAHSTANIQCKYGNALFCAWSKNTAGNSNYDLRGAGECVFTPGARTQPATAIMAFAVLENVVWCLLRDLNARNCE